MLSKSQKKMTSAILIMLLSSILLTGRINQKVLGTEVNDSPQIISEIDIVQSPIEGSDKIENEVHLDQNLLQSGGLTIDGDIVNQVIDPRLEALIYNELMAMESEIYLTNFTVTTTEIFEVYQKVVNNHPDLFHVNGALSAVTMNGKVAYIIPRYSYEKSKAATMRAQFNAEVDNIKAIITPGMSDLEIALAVNDYLVVKVAYDMDNYRKGTIPVDSYNAYGVMVLNTAVCQGYALAYKYILESIFGIPTEYVVSTSMNHAWNMVLIDDNYYHVDVTWNDPVSDTLGNAHHYYFMLSDQEMAKRDHYDWTSPVKGLSTRFDDYFWKNVNSPFARVLDKYYYVDSLGKLIEWNYSADTHKILKQLNNRWYVSSSQYYPGAFQKVFTARGKIFFNEPDGIYSIEVDGSGYKREYTAGTLETGLPFSFAYKNSQFQYILSSSPYLTGNELIKVASVILGPDVTGIALSSESFTVVKGQTDTLTATVSPYNAMNKNVIWRSSNTAVASVSSGNVTAHSIGEATITATTIDGDITASAKVTVISEEYKNELEVLAGVNRYETAVEISKFTNLTSDTAILVLGTDFPDALAAGPLAMMYNAPILLSHNNRISSITLNELKRLKVNNVILLGGEAVITTNVEDSLMENGITQITRIAGNNRFETAEKAAYHLTRNQKQAKVILVSGENFADALSVGSYASKEGIPILLSRKGVLPSATKNALKNLMVDEVLILGGTSAIDEAVVNEILVVKTDMKITRIQGVDRYSTAVEVSGTYFGDAKQGIIASGVQFADALAAAPFAAKNNIPILLVSDRSVSTTLSEHLKERFEHLYIIGGDVAIGVQIRKDLLYQIN